MVVPFSLLLWNLFFKCPGIQPVLICTCVASLISIALATSRGISALTKREQDSLVTTLQGREKTHVCTL